uniref:ARID domain-containing protein n=1 Tax=Scleropages formosus TaxID=113540 RepID=A0A8C9T6X7_SCLFO
MSQEGVCEGPSSEQKDLNEENFLKELYLFMRNRDTPIERIPHLGFKQIDLFLMYKTVQKLGGYSQVTAHQLWKQVYNELGGNPRSTSAATCTRRHYEKLILPFEWHLRGKDDKDLPLPRQQKRIIPVPMHYRYFHSGHHPLPNYSPISPTMHSPHSHPHCPIQRMPPHQELSEWPEQRLALLRSLAKEFTSGWAEPLNLSCKEGRMDTLKQQPSSFTPTSSSNKTPRFLNKASPLDGTMQSPPQSPFLAKDPHIVDLTLWNHCSTVTAPAIPLNTGSSPTHRCTLDNSAAKTPERSCSQQKEDEEAYSPTPFPLDLSGVLPTSPKNSMGRMEIQIPLGVLQDLLKGRFQMASILQSDRDLKDVGDGRIECQSNAETVTLGEDPADLSIKENARERKTTVEVSHRASNLERMRSSTSSSSKDSHDQCHESMSTCQESMDSKTHKVESLSEYRGGTKFSKLIMADSSTTGNVSHPQMYSQFKEYEVWKERATRNMQIQDSMLDRRCVQAPSSPVWLYPESRVREHEIKVHPAPGFTANLPQSMASQFRAAQGVSLGLPERRSVSDVPTMVMANHSSPSVLSLTPEEYFKLRQLISSSP